MEQQIVSRALLGGSEQVDAAEFFAGLVDYKQLADMHGVSYALGVLGNDYVNLRDRVLGTRWQELRDAFIAYRDKLEGMLEG